MPVLVSATAACETHCAFLGTRIQQARGALRKLLVFCAVGASVVLTTACGGSSGQVESPPTDPAVVAQGKQIFRFDTFGDESQWTDTLRMHEVICTAVDPTTVLSVGLKGDAEAPPATEAVARLAALFSALPIFRVRSCDILLPNHDQELSKKTRSRTSWAIVNVRSLSFGTAS